MVGNIIEYYLEAQACGDDARAEEAVRHISKLPPEEKHSILESLHALLHSPKSDQRWWAARALAEIDDPRVPDWLLTRLADPDASIRQCAALGLSQHPVVHSIPPLVEALNDPDQLVARLAGDALVKNGEAAVLPLIEAVQRKDKPSCRPGPHSRREAVRALAKIGDKRAAPALFEFLEDDSALLVYWAEQGLERMGVGMVFFTP